MLTYTQIRVHLGHMGHPILGDDFYGVMGPWIGRQVWTAVSLDLKQYKAHLHQQHSKYAADAHVSSAYRAMHANAGPPRR